jgi:hypothetical protein
MSNAGSVIDLEIVELSAQTPTARQPCRSVPAKRYRIAHLKSQVSIETCTIYLTFFEIDAFLGISDILP